MPTNVYWDNAVSIHAPAKGATWMYIHSAFIWQFQSTLPRRERHADTADKPALKQFQSTLPRRERLELRGSSVDCNGFNPRSREGSDLTVVDTESQKLVFQSTLPRRERHSRNPLCAIMTLFQSTLPRRERQLQLRSKNAKTAFQSTLPRRERLSSHLPPPSPARVSIHAPAKGATTLYGQALAQLKFQSTLPRRERLLLHQEV